MMACSSLNPQQESQPQNEASAELRHPLLFPEIVAKVCHMLCVEDLKASRLLNKIWNREASAELQSIIQNVILCHSKHAKKFAKIFDKQNIFLPNPFRSFVLHHASSSEMLKALPLPNPYNKKWEMEFIQSFGHHIETLRLSRLPLHHHMSLQNLQMLLITHCPNLESLTLEVRAVGEPSSPAWPNRELAGIKSFCFIDHNELSPRSLIKLLQSMPLLESFEYRFIKPRTSTYERRLINIVDVFTETYQYNVIKLRALKYVDFDPVNTELGNRDVENLLQLEELNLTTFKAAFSVVTIEEWNILCVFVSTLEPTILNLDLRFKMFDNQLCQTGFPIMQYVECITIVFNYHFEMLLNCFPNSTKCHVVHDYTLRGDPESAEDDDYDQDIWSQDSFLHTAIRSLHFEGHTFFQREIEQLGLSFKNLKVLEIDVYSDKDLKEIWTSMTGLKSLTILIHGRITDTGFFEKTTKQSEKTDLINLENPSLEQQKAVANLGHLKDLQALHINAEKFMDFKFTDALIIGIASLENLRNLTLPPNIPPKHLENSIHHLTKLSKLRRLCLCEATFNNLLPLHSLKLELSPLDILVKYATKQGKQELDIYWKTERLHFPDFLPQKFAFGKKQKSKDGEETSK